jgi:hypothetical protein
MAETPPQLPDRIQRDLEEALRDGGVDKLPSRPRRQRRAFRLHFPDPRPRYPSDLIILAVGLLLAAYIIPVPFRAQLAVLGIACLAVAIVTHFLQPTGSKPKFWRGRYLDVPTGQWQERLYRMIYRRSI